MSTGDSGRLLADRYRLSAGPGRGEVGVVRQGRDEVLGREVAVKEVRAAEELSPAEVRALCSRLEREAMTAGRISHRNAISVHDVVIEDSRLWIVMELVRGLSPAAALEAEGPMSPAGAARIGAGRSSSSPPSPASGEDGGGGGGRRDAPGSWDADRGPRGVLAPVAGLLVLLLAALAVTVVLR